MTFAKYLLQPGDVYVGSNKSSSWPYPKSCHIFNVLQSFNGFQKRANLPSRGWKGRFIAPKKMSEKDVLAALGTCSSNLTLFRALTVLFGGPVQTVTSISDHWHIPFRAG